MTLKNRINLWVLNRDIGNLFKEIQTECDYTKHLQTLLNKLILKRDQIERDSNGWTGKIRP